MPNPRRAVRFSLIGVGLGILLLALFFWLHERRHELRLHQPKAALLEALSQTVPALMRRNNIPSVSIAVIRNGQIEFERTFNQPKSQLNVEPIYEVASLGKPVFAYLVVSLAQAGLIDLDRPLVEYAPELFSAQHGDLDLITARMVLSHTSGLGNFGTKPTYKLKFKPGNGFQYSGIGYDALQTVVEKITGKSLENLAQTYVFKPLGMTSTSYIWKPSFERRFVLGHDKDGKTRPPTRRPTAGHAAWSLYSTASDYAKFTAFQITSAARKDSAASVMLTPAVKITDKISWGLGWGLQATTPHSSFWHWGSNPGFHGYVVGYPVEKIGVVVLSNSDRLFKIIEPTITAAIGGALPSYHWF